MSCPHCHGGFMIPGQDYYGAYMYCLTCGFYEEETDLETVEDMADELGANESKNAGVASHRKVRL